MDLSTYLTDRQIQEINNTIVNACIRYRAYDKQFGTLFYEPYTVMRKKNTVTTAVISAFSPEVCNISGFTSKDINYGAHGKLSQPELTSDNAIIQIYSNGSDLKGNPIKERSATYNQDLSGKPLFMIVVFSVDKDGMLSRIEIKIPDVSGIIIDTQTIYESPKCIDIAI